MMDQVDFFMGGQVVGAFPTQGLPITDGSYRYEPYRGPGHLNLHMELKAGKAPRCFFRNASQRVSFCVTSSPTQGVLTLSGVEVADDL